MLSFVAMAQQIRQLTLTCIMRVLLLMRLT